MRGIRRKVVSVTFRLIDKSPKTPGLSGGDPVQEWNSTFTAEKSRSTEDLNTIREICDSINNELLFPNDPSYKSGELHGLILVTGATASAKSLIARGLIDDYLKESLQIAKRRQHLVTLEDPIEKHFLPINDELLKNHAGNPNEAIPIPTHAIGVDYTPRLKENGIPSLGDALSDALRQTPKVFFVGETREAEDWKEIMKFAGSGHLVVTTAHAGSLVESFELIFKSNKVKSAAARNHIASRILGVIHLKRLKINDLSVLLPSVWRRTPASVNDLTAAGFKSLLPGNGESDPSLGRKYFASKLLEAAGDDKGHGTVIMQEAIKMDLRGE